MRTKALRLSACLVVLATPSLAAETQRPEMLYDEAAGYTLRLGTDAARQAKIEAEVRAARAAFLPTVTVGGEWVLEGSTDYHPPSIVALDPDSYPTKDPSILAIEASLVVFDGAKRLNILRAATAMADAGRGITLDSRQQLFLDAARTGLAVVRDRTIAEIRRAAAERQRRTLQIARQMLVEESVTLTDIALASTRVAEAEARLAGAVGAREASEIAFRTLIGRAPQRTLALAVPPARLPKSEAEAAARAENGAPIIGAARAVAEAATYRVDAARSAYYPTIELVGRASTRFDVSPVIDQVDNYTGLVRLRMPIFDPTLKPAVDGARAEALQRRYEADSARLQAGAIARTAFAERRASAAQSASLSRQIASARDAVRGMGIEQGLGTRTVDDVLEAQSHLADAEIVAAEIAYRRDEAGFALLAAMGELGDADVPSPALLTASRAGF